jgi:hypothetical protein
MKKKTTKASQPEKKFAVDIFADGKFVQNCIVEARDAWHARTRAMFVYTGPSGILVTYNVAETPPVSK